MAQFSEKFSEWPQINWHVQAQKYKKHATYTPEAQIVARFALRLAVFELQPDFRKRAPK